MKNLSNFRGFGHIKVMDGRSVADLVFRSAALEGLLAEDIDYLVGQNIKYVVDFRDNVDSRVKSAEVPGAIVKNINLLQNLYKNYTPMEEYAKTINAKLASEHMKEIYYCLIVSESAINGYKEFFRHLLEADGATLFHCQAGKDRTGIAAYLFLKLLGAGYNDIIADYLQTIEAKKETNAKLLEKYKQNGLLAENLEGVEILISVSSEYLEFAIKTIDNEFGSFENYISNIIGLSEEDIKTLKEKYLFD